MWKKKVAAALGMTFLAGSLTFGSTASAYIINVGMEDLAAQEKTADSREKQEKKAETVKEHGNAKDEKKKEIKNFREKKAETSVKEADKKVENSDTKKTIEEAPKASVTPVPQKREEGQKPLVLNKKKEEMKPSVQKKADESKVPLQGKKMEAPVQANKDSVKTKNKKSKEKDRFQEIFRDESFIYYMDTRSVRNVPIPNRQDRMIDVWVKLKPNSFSDEEDAKAGKYYLEHYYLNPKSKQIQFLCELEVTGRPSNAIKERPYSSQNWENLVPGSVEDDIYHAVVKKAKSSSSIGGVAIPSASDVLDMLNIGL